MIKDKEIIYTTADCLQQTVNILKHLSVEYGWEDNKEFIKNIYILSTLGYVLTHDEYKEELIMFFKLLGNKLKENNNLIKEANYHANITKGKE
tara:strand:+ start:666 stop:944 length:279 start_codon:yes stop_codon:yes gene_type:complete